MASPLERALKTLRRFDETGGAQQPNCEHSSEKQVVPHGIMRAMIRMYDTLHLPARLVHAFG